MGLQSAMTTALTGLQAAETTIDVVGNNVANSNTVGFKESEAVFATQFLQTVSIGSAPSTNNGGTNPRQIGLGVKVAAITPDFSQGTIEISSNPLDVAIQGDGFLMVQGGNSRLYTRNGQLKLNSANEVVTTTGQRVLGYGVNDEFDLITDSFVPLSIPLGAEYVAAATENVKLNGVLNPDVDLGATPSVSESAVLGDGTIAQPVADTGVDFDISDFRESEPPDVSGVTAAYTGGNTNTVSYRVVPLDANGFEGEASVAYEINDYDSGAITLNNLPDSSTPPWDGGLAIYRLNSFDSTYEKVVDLASGVTTYADLDPSVFSGDDLGEDAIDPGTYSYYVTYYNTTTAVETRPSARIGAISVGSPSGKIHINLDDLADPPAGFDRMRIYRNLSDSSGDFHRVDDIPSTQTTYVDTLSSDGSTSSSALEEQPEINLDGPPADNDTLLTDLVLRDGDAYVTNFFSDGVLAFTGRKDGVELATKELDITSATTVGDLMNFVQGALGIDTETDVPDTPFPTAGSVSLVNGQIVVQSNLGEENAVEIPQTAFRFTATGETASETIPIRFSETQQADGPGTSTEIIVYDSLGLPLKVRVTTVLEEKNPNSTVYRWYASSAENEPSSGVSTVIGDGLLEFDSQGNLTNATQDEISISRSQTASESPLAVTLDFSTVKALGVTDPQGEPISTLDFQSQDGFPPGVMTDFIITEDGTIQGQFSNGTQRLIGQLVMARFANNEGLTQVGDSLFDVGVNSGEPIFGTPGSEGIGSITSGAVELSNTDVGQNLIELILASTQYRSGARVITAAQELLDELLALRR